MQLRKGLFTSGALDNLDHNLTSTTATDSFHGTAMSLFQSPTKSNPGYPQDGIRLISLEAKKKIVLPDNYTVVPAITFKKDKIQVPKPLNKINAVVDHLEGAQAQERCWLEHSIKQIEKTNMDEGDIIAWSAYHASLQHPSDDIQPALTQLLPLFNEKAATASMIKHGMDMLKEATQFLNPGQIPVIALDAPLYALAKYVQWNWPQTHGESKYVVMFGVSISKWQYGIHWEITWSHLVGLLH